MKTCEFPIPKYSTYDLPKFEFCCLDVRAKPTLVGRRDSGVPALHGVPRVGRRQLLSLLLRVSGEKIGAFRLKLGRDDPYSVHMVICTLNMGYKASRIIKFANWLEIRKGEILLLRLFPRSFLSCFRFSESTS